VTAAEAVGRALAALGVRDAFGVIGSGNFLVTQALHAAGARFHHARHEGGAISMADGYARVSGRVGVCSVHQGPGFTNMLTGLTEAAKSRTPLLVLAGDTPAAAVRSNFRIDQAGVATTLGAVAERIHSAESAVADAARALRRAEVERRPVVLNLPLDVQAQEAPEPAIPPPPVPALDPPSPSPDAIAVVGDLLRAAERPLVLAGRGGVLAGARVPLIDLADAAGALLATSAMGHGLFHGHPYALGISGGFASPVAARLIRQADLILAFGASLTRWTTRDGALIGPGAKVVQVDLDEEAIGANRPVDAGVVGDAALAADALVALGIRGEGFRRPGLAEEIAAGGWRDEPYEDAGDGDRMDPRALSVALDDLLPHDRIVAVDSGHFMGWPPMFMHVPDPAGFVFTQAYQSIGLGLASGMGAAIARPDRLTVACLGDGGLLMALPELETLARLRLPMLVVVYDDAAYGAEVHHFGPMGHPTELVRFPEADFAALARAAGAQGLTARSVADLDGVRDWLERRDGPLVVDAKVRPDVVAEWLEEAFR
jgi:thiamine pyrophosphate-dependent acetolactate synthase large subunit-like protein